MALSWAGIPGYILDLRPAGRAGQATTLGASGATAFPSGAWLAGTQGFPTHVGASSAGLVAFGMGPMSDGSTSGLGAYLAKFSGLTADRRSHTVALLVEAHGSAMTTGFNASPNRQNQILWALTSGGESIPAVGHTDRQLVFSDGAGPGSSDWWAWSKFDQLPRIPCNLQLIVIRRNGTSVTINTSAANQQTKTVADVAAGNTAEMFLGSANNNNNLFGSVVRVGVWSGQLSDANVAALFDDAYLSGAIAPGQSKGDVVVLGDSISCGYYAFQGRPWITRLLTAAHAARRRVWNYARAGEKANGSLVNTLAGAIASTNADTLTQARLRTLFGPGGEMLPPGSDVVYFQGANDLLTISVGSGVTGQMIAFGARAAAQLLKSWGARVHVVEPLPLRQPGWTGAQGLESETVRRAYRELMLAQVGADIDSYLSWDGSDVEPYALTDAELVRVTQGPLFQINDVVNSNLMDAAGANYDGIHPGPIGHEVVGSAITRHVMGQITARLEAAAGGSGGSIASRSSTVISFREGQVVHQPVTNAAQASAPDAILATTGHDAASIKAAVEALGLGVRYIDWAAEGSPSARSIAVGAFAAVDHAAAAAAEFDVYGVALAAPGVVTLTKLADIAFGFPTPAVPAGTIPANAATGRPALTAAVTATANASAALTADAGSVVSSTASPAVAVIRLPSRYAGIAIFCSTGTVGAGKNLHPVTQRFVE